jgi:chromosome segregation ATPase
MERFNEQEEELRLMSQRSDELLGHQQELEMVCSKLQNAVDVREEDLSVMKNELEVVRGQLTHAMDAHSYNRNRDICSLENKVDDLQIEVEYYKIKAHEAESLHHHLSNHAMELKSILKENNEMLEQEKDIRFLTKKNRCLENEGEVQRSMLEEQEKDITSLRQILVKLNNVIKSQDIDLDKKDSAILQLR